MLTLKQSIVAVIIALVYPFNFQSHLQLLALLHCEVEVPHFLLRFVVAHQIPSNIHHLQSLFLSLRGGLCEPLLAGYSLQQLSSIKWLLGHHYVGFLQGLMDAHGAVVAVQPGKTADVDPALLGMRHLVCFVAVHPLRVAARPGEGEGELPEGPQEGMRGHHDNQVKVIGGTQLVYSNMSVGFPIDVTRLLGDNQRFQRDLSLAHQLQHQLRAQLDQTLAANQVLRMQCEQLERQKSGELNNFIASHQELYENEISTLRLERQELIRKIREHEKEEPDPEVEQTIKDLNLQINKHERQKKSMEQDLATIKKLMAQQQEEVHLNFSQQIKQKEFQIKELESMNVGLKDAEEALRNQVNRGKIDNAMLEENYMELKQQYERLEANWNAVAGKSSADILAQLILLRNQNLSLGKETNQRQLNALSNDEQVYALVKKLHEDLAMARYELMQVKNGNSQVEIRLQNERIQSRNEKAQQQLQIIKLQKELSATKEQDKQIKAKLHSIQEKLKGKVEQSIMKQKVEEEIALLKIKVFVLESLRGSEKYRKKDELDYAKYEAQFEAFQAFKLKSSRIDVLKNVASMHIAMSQTIEKLKQQQTKKRDLARKSKEYKAKWQAVSKREAEALRLLSRQQQKQVQYQKLIEKMQEELQKAYMSTSQVDERKNSNILLASYQQKLSMVNNQLLFLRSQLNEYEKGNSNDKRAQQKEIYRLNIQMKQLDQNYNQLLQKNKALENKLLEQTLTAATNKAGKNYQAELAQKTAALIMTEQELQSLREQLYTERENNQQHTSTISRLQEEISKLNRHAVPPTSNFNYQLNYLQQKLSYLQGVLGEQRNASNASNDNHIRTLYQQIAQLKTETQQTKHEYYDKSDRHVVAQSEIESYRGRLMELEQALRGIANENEQKSLEIFKLNQENNLLSKQLDKIEEQLDVLRGKAGSMKQIDLIDRNKQLEDETEAIRKDLSRAIQSLQMRSAQMQALRKECEQYWSDNLKLLVVIKENNLQLKENKFLTEKYDQEVNNRQQQLEVKIESLLNQNQILKNLIEDLRKSVLVRQSQKQHQESSKKSDIEELKKELQIKERENFYFQDELHRLLEERTKQKGLFDEEWNKLVAQLKDLRNQLHQQEQSKKQGSVQKQSIKSQTFDQDSRIKILLAHQQQEDDLNLMNFRNMIAQLETEVARKDEKIEQLQSQLSDFKFSFKRSGIYSQEVIELRNQVQILMEGRFALQDKIRNLQQENGLLKIKRITEDVDAPQQTFSQETFGPSLATTKLIEQLRDSQEVPVDGKIGELKSWNDRYQETLCTLVISFAEIESLRKANNEMKEREDRQFRDYTERLRHIQNSLNVQYSPDVDLDLLRELQCGHKHLVGLSQLGLKEGTVGLAQLGSFTESITGGKMIESYSVREEDESLTSQQIIHM